jgi:hypothetical protein
MIYVQIDEDDFIDRMNKAHESTTHGFSEGGLKALSLLCLLLLFCYGLRTPSYHAAANNINYHAAKNIN